MKQDTFGEAVCNGFDDRYSAGLLRVEQLYRAGPVQKLGWRLGWELANMLTQRPLRTAKRPPAGEGGK